MAKGTHVYNSLKFLFFALIFLCAQSAFATDPFGYNNVDSDSQFVWAAGGAASCSGSPCGLALSGQTGWVLNSGDIPGGAWLCGAGDGSSGPCVATITLPQALVSGTTYYAFSYGIDYDNGQTFKFTQGGNDSTTGTFNDRNTTIRYWSPRVTLVAGANSTTLTFTVMRAPFTKYDFGGIYITTNSAVIVMSDNYARNLVSPTIMDDSAAVAGNVIVNSSFEAPPDASWVQDQHLLGLIADRWDCTVSHSGSCSIKIPLSAAARKSGILDAPTGITSKVIHLAPNKKYTLACYFKLDVGSTFGVPLGLDNIFYPTDGFDPHYGFSKFQYISASDGWVQVHTEVTGNYSVAYPSADFTISILPNGLEGSNLYVDDCILTQGNDPTYSAANALDVMVTPTKAGGVYYADDTLTATLRETNSTGSTATGTYAWEIWDVGFGTLAASGTASLSISANSTTTTTQSVAVGGRLGNFRFVGWLSGLNNSEFEFTYSIVPHPSTSGVDTASYLGIHPNFVDATSAIFQRLGIKWARSLSPSGQFRWDVGEPTEGSFVYDDASPAEATSYGMTVLANIGSFVPAYAVSAGCPILSKVTTYYTTIVHHYKAAVHYWEVMNEDSKNNSPYSYACYASVLKTAADAITAEDATAKVIGMGGLSPTDITAVLAQLASQYSTWDPKTHLYAISSHDYPGGIDPAGLTPFVTDGYKVWNTETGEITAPNPQGLGTTANIAPSGKALFQYLDARRLYLGFEDNPNLAVMNLARTIASGQTNYEMYDGRIGFESPLQQTAPGSSSILGYDASVHANGVAYAILGHLIDKSIGQGNKATDNDSYLLPFDTGGTSPVAVLGSGSNSPHQIVLAGISHGDCVPQDRMGNVIAYTGTTIPYGRNPTYLACTGISIGTLITALGGTVTAIADTVAPHTMILDGPRGPLAPAAEPFRMRWMALDDNSLPNLGETNQESLAATNTPNPDAIVYSYKLSPYSDWSAYSAVTYFDYSSIPSGAYTFSVRARDAAGNVSTSQTRDITITGSTASAGAGRERLR